MIFMRDHRDKVIDAKLCKRVLESQRAQSRHVSVSNTPEDIYLKSRPGDARKISLKKFFLVV